MTTRTPTRASQRKRQQSRRRFLQAAASAGLIAAGAGARAATAARDADEQRKSSTPQRIDIHHHIVPDFYVRALHGIGIHDVAGVPFPAWSPETLRTACETLAIGKAIVSISAPGVYFGDAGFASELARRCNEFTADLMRKEPKRIGGFAAIPLPSVKDSIAETAHALDVLGLHGVCLLSNYDGAYLGDARFEDYLAYLNRRSAVVFLHPTMPPEAKQPDMPLSPSILEFVFDTTRAIASLLFTGALERFPNIRFIVAHLGGTLATVAWRLQVLDQSPRDPYRKFRERAPHPVSHYLSRLYYDVAVSASPGNLRTVLDLAGPQRILFGSDFPFLPPPLLNSNTQSVFESGVFDAPTLQAVAAGNAARLFARPA